MTRPLLLDLFCGAGGASMGYYRAGFTIIGVDIEEQPNYPFDFWQLDVTKMTTEMMRHVDAIHASPPCQAHSDLQKQNKRTYADHIPHTRELLIASGLPYVIENVEGAPLIRPVMLCGTMFTGLRVIRHRLFETNFPVVAPPHRRKHPITFTYDKRKGQYGKVNQDVSFVQVTGGGNVTLKNARDAMGIDWMKRRELNEAIPPAYTQYLGGFLRASATRRGHVR